jgi:hypothetical protein
MIAPPTDSLYKFMTVGGILLFLGSAAFIWTRIESYEERLSDAYTEASVVQYQSEHLGKAT